MSMARATASEAVLRLASDLLEIGRDAGLDAVGIAPADPFDETRRHLEERKSTGLHGGMKFTYRDPATATDPRSALAGARALVVGARAYAKGGIASPGTTPNAGAVARYAREDHYAELRRALAVVARHLESDGWRTEVLVDDNRLVDREAAYRAGLGWYGKNTNLLIPGRGSWFVLGSVATDAPLPDTGPPRGDGCGSCSKCLPACPTGALAAPGVLDARRCLAWLLQAKGEFPREHRVALGGRVYGCDDCQEACPPSRVELRRADETSAGSEDEIDLLWLLTAPDAAILERVGRWYIPGRKVRYVRRNALIALGNVGRGADDEVATAIRRYLDSPDSLLRSHAVWAAAQLDRRDLLTGMREHERDGAVLDELALAASDGERP